MTKPIHINAGDTLVITGGSRGIGAAVARLAAKKKYNIALLWHSNHVSADHACQQARKTGIQCRTYQVDIRSLNQVRQCFGQVIRDFGSIRGLVNCAANHPERQSLLDMPNTEIEKTIDTIFSGSLYCMREAAGYMSTTQDGTGGVIINLSSEAACYGGNQLSVYAASKAAINTLTHSLARELANKDIRINAVSPGIIDTGQQSPCNPDDREKILTSIPMQRMGTAEEVAEAILWLMSKESRYITGTILSINGGR